MWIDIAVVQRTPVVKLFFFVFFFFFNQAEFLHGTLYIFCVRVNFSFAVDKMIGKKKKKTRQK